MTTTALEQTVAALKRQRQRELVLGIAAVLETASHTALRSWDKDRCDMYHCATRSWRSLGMPVAFTAVNAEIRRVVPDRNIMVFQDVEGRTRHEVAAVFTQARQRLLTACAELLDDLDQDHHDSDHHDSAPADYSMADALVVAGAA